ncbi:MAG: hypothetical protein MK066_03575 [Crocinitomicaceae bacterium]|nr:hypothetical protein [Crocinitomicaceae bacterium]
MNCTINVYLLNDHFSIEHAEANNNGKESELNRKYEWEDELKITTDVTNIVQHEGAGFPLEGEMPDGTKFSHEVKGMRLFEVKGEVSTYVGCSESILDSFEIIEGDDLNLKIYIKDYEPMSNPIPGIYIASQEFPKELIV